MNNGVETIFQEVPEIPDSFQLISSSSRTANVTWKIPYDGNSPIVDFQVQFKKSQGTFLDLL